jgi:hypothetical protein
MQTQQQQQQNLQNHAQTDFQEDELSVKNENLTLSSSLLSSHKSDFETNNESLNEEYSAQLQENLNSEPFFSSPSSSSYSFVDDCSGPKQEMENELKDEDIDVDDFIEN